VADSTHGLSRKRLDLTLDQKAVEAVAYAEYFPSAIACAEHRGANDSIQSRRVAASS